MSNRRKRWLRRLAVGISFAALAAPAAAQPVQAATSGGDVGIASQTAAARRDDKAARSSSSNVSTVSAPTTASVSWDGAVTLGVGALVLVLALGLGGGYMRRPKIAGL